MDFLASECVRNKSVIYQLPKEISSALRHMCHFNQWSEDHLEDHSHLGLQFHSLICNCNWCANQAGAPWHGPFLVCLNLSARAHHPCYFFRSHTILWVHKCRKQLVQKLVSNIGIVVCSPFPLINLLTVASQLASWVLFSKITIL